MTEQEMKGLLAMCIVLSNGKTLIYLDNIQKWVEPCEVQVHPNDKISFWPLQIFGESYLVEPIDPRHIVCKYVPEMNVEEAYRGFLSGYFQDANTRRQRN